MGELDECAYYHALGLPWWAWGWGLTIILCIVHGYNRTRCDELTRAYLHDHIRALSSQLVQQQRFEGAPHSSQKVVPEPFPPPSQHTHDPIWNTPLDYINTTASASANAFSSNTASANSAPKSSNKRRRRRGASASSSSSYFNSAQSSSSREPDLAFVPYPHEYPVVYYASERQVFFIESAAGAPLQPAYIQPTTTTEGEIVWILTPGLWSKTYIS